MKKTIAIFSILLSTIIHCQTEKISTRKYLRAGLNYGIPSWQYKDVVKFGAGADVALIFQTPNKLNLGFFIGYSHQEGQLIKIRSYNSNDFSSTKADKDFLILGGTAHYAFFNRLIVGGDLGYAIGQNRDDEGFFYYPKLGYQTKRVDYSIGHKGIKSVNRTYSTFNLGVNYKFL